MTISAAKESDYYNLIEFNTRIYSNKIMNSRVYLDYWLSKANAIISDYVILKDDVGRIRGQILTTPMAYYYNQERTETVWLFDLIVDEELRKTAWGVDLLMACMDFYPASCSTGSGPAALPLHLKLGNSMLGELRKYVSIINPVYMLTSYHRKRVSIDSFPKEIESVEGGFRKIGKNELPIFDAPFNEKLFEISREKSFLEWRFFNDLHQYAFYLNEERRSYFVVRSILVKGLRVLELVDYRCSADRYSFDNIIKTVHKVAKAVHLPAVVCGSSLDSFDVVLEQHRYKSIGRARPIVGFVKCSDRHDDIAKRNFCFVTLADSDGETNWI